MSEAKNYRMERVERLLKELQYEVTRGMIEGEFESEEIGFRFYVPVSKSIRNGVVACEFRTRPMPSVQARMDDLQPRLKVIK
jgi:hypothetical protein